MLLMQQTPHHCQNHFRLPLPLQVIRDTNPQQLKLDDIRLSHTVSAELVEARLPVLLNALRQVQGCGLT